MTNLGANLECYNDEGFTPLNLSLMRYISLLNDVQNWTEYLIPDIDLKCITMDGKFSITYTTNRLKNSY